MTYHIYFDKKIESVVMEWNGYANSSEFRAGTEKMLRELEEQKTSKVLADIKNMVLIAQNDQAWLLDYFIPKAIDRGFGRIAIVKPDHYFNQVALEEIFKKIDRNKLKIQLFDTLDEAREWLMG
ncbi:MAG: STAS/SEC14 domain-containing protein [Bacteroidia bacterium]|nr:STAS/SEC14 domain-containing protein [Bacteroidia bacterium]